MQKNYFLLLKKFKNTESAQLWHRVTEFEDLSMGTEKSVEKVEKSFGEGKLLYREPLKTFQIFYF